MNIMDKVDLRRRLGELEYRHFELMRDVTKLAQDADAEGDQYTLKQAIKLAESIMRKDSPTEG